MLALLLALQTAAAPAPYVHWESPHVHPLELTPDGARLLAVSTGEARLDVLDAGADPPRLALGVPVGLEPVTVRAESAQRAWVVNHVSDSISVVDLERGVVVATLQTDDEPCDVVFAGAPRRAYVSCSQAGTLLVFDPAQLDAAPERLALAGDEPRALAVAPDGATVYVAFFESGNASTVLGGGALFNVDFPPNVVNKPMGPYSGANPPPNSHAPGGFTPARPADQPPPPAVGLIVKRDAEGRWRDDFVGDWTPFVSGAHAPLSGRVPGWEVRDHDVAVLDTRSGALRYVGGRMNACMALGVRPSDGALTLVGTDATNEVRYEPVLRGRFLRVLAAQLGPAGEDLGRADLNPHLDYARAALPAAERTRALGDPRAVVWDVAGARAFVCGRGSDNVIELGPDGARHAELAPIEVAEGPTGLALDEARGRLYVLAKHAAALSVVDLATRRERARVALPDATPEAVRAGRRVLYGTHARSGLGHIACASCHLDARSDGLAWDLGDPSGAARALADRNLAADDPRLLESRVPGRGAFEPWHPMKGPMVTQSLQDVVGAEPLHWRGDRDGLREFAGAFVSLQGADAPPTDAELDALTAFLASVAYPPNPYRALDDTLPTRLELPGHVTTGRFGPAGRPLPPGDARRGLALFRTAKLDNGAVDCVTCHTLPTGLGPDARLGADGYAPLAAGPNGERHHMLVAQDGSTNVSMKVPQLRGLYEKVGCDLGAPVSARGFGFLHDGSVDTLARFVNEASFSVASDQDTADLVALLLAFGGADLGAAADEPPGSRLRETHAAVGRQLTLAGALDDVTRARLAALAALADRGAIDLVVHGVRAGERGAWTYLGAARLRDGRGDELALERLVAGAAPGAELTFTAVPAGSAARWSWGRAHDGAATGAGRP